MKYTWRTATAGIALLTASAVLVTTPHAIAEPKAPAAVEDPEAAEFDRLIADLEKELAQEEKDGKKAQDDALAAFRANPVREAESVEAAQVAAAVQNHRVEVLQMRTETDTVYANPDGTLTREMASGPVRMIEGGRWVDVDADFAAAKDGKVAAKAHPQGLRLAGKGGVLPRSVEAAANAPASLARDLVTLGSGKDRMAVQWKGGLPAPELQGNVATYKNAVPGGDLIVESTRTGFEQFLKLHRAPEGGAGAPMVLPMTVPDGVRATQNPDGSVTFTDAAGEELALMPAPVMWDSAVDAKSLERTNTKAIDLKIAQRGNTVELTLTPDAAWLADPKTQYPVTIDPAADALDVLFDTFVQGGDTKDQSASTDLKLGWPGDHAGTTKRTARSYLTFRTSNFADSLVSKATLKMWNYHSWSCEKRGWEVWAADPADKNTRWTKQPALKEKIATSTQTKSATCNNEGWVSADITKLAQTWSSAKATTGSIGLKAASESDTYAWKRFYSSESPDQNRIPTLEVTYNYRPSNGTNLQAGTPFISQGGIFKVNSTTPTLRFSATDSNGDDTVTGTYEITDTSTGTVVGMFNAPAVPSNSTSTLKVPAGKLVNGRTYSFRTTAYDGTHYANGWSAPVRFTVDTAWKPSAAETSLGLANLYSDAADITAATASDGTYASIAATEENTVSIPWDGKNDVIDIKNADMPAKLTIPQGSAKGVRVGGNVVYTSSGPVDTVVQPTTDGGSRTLHILKNASAPREYETGFVVPAGMKAVSHEDGSVSLYAEGDDDPTQAPKKDAAGFFDAPWAKDANGKDIPTRYKVVGKKLVQQVDFDANSAFPIVIDPSWWSTTKKITKCAVYGVSPIVLGFTPAGSTMRVVTAIRLAKRMGFKKTAKLIYNYSKRRKMTPSVRKAIGTLMGIDGIKKNCKF
ncbi:DNRLRE domain-containing protein [Streptomyces sp. NPDC087440]|uniref:DNRLRE domain-containing protein n=1 Tax=Streptomyces sp. NPDC087440 TaxID=3365790 RepID=UPI003817FCB2